MANDQDKFDLARKFTDGLQKTQKESLLKVNLARRVYVAAQENDGAVPPPKPVGRPPFLNEHEQAVLKANVATNQLNMECIRVGNVGCGSFGAFVMDAKSSGHNNSSTEVPLPSRKTMQRYQNAAADGGEKTGRNKNVKRVAWI